MDDAGPPAALASFGAETGADFHGSKHEYIAVAHDEAFQADNGTVQLWFNTRQTRGGQALFSKNHSGFANGGHLNIGLDGARIVVRLQGTDHGYTIRTDKLIQQDTWYHLAFTFGEGGMQLYLNGQRVGDNGFTGGLNGNSAPIVIGGSIRTNRNDSGDLSNLKIGWTFNGHIDEVAFYDTALSAEQIQQLIQAGPLGVVAEKATAGVQPADDEVLPGMTLLPSASWVDGFLNDMAAADNDDGANGNIKIEL